MLNYSRYNYMVKIPDEDAYALYNFRTGALLRLDQIKKALFDHASDISEDAKGIKALRQGGFLVAYDELRHMRTQALAAGGTGKSLGLTICPTLACNFSCPYCFEKSRSGRMTPEVQDNIVDFARETLEKERLEELDVVWFGGEPLLCPDIIESLSARLIEVCRELGSKYSARILTNGWFLTAENIAVLDRSRVSFLQVTLDGPSPETNDHLRRPKEGGSSFQRIMENLKNLRPFKSESPQEHQPGVMVPQVQVRCNVNRENARLFGKLAGCIKTVADETGVSISAYAAKMDSSEENPQYISDGELKSDEYGRLIGAEALICKMPQKYRRIYCMAQYPYGYAIDELGNLYKCSEMVGRDEFVVGNVRDFRVRKEPKEDLGLVDAFFETVFPEQDEECMDCKVFPLCLGGCPRKRVLGQRECWSLKDNLDGFVLAQYRMRKC